MKITKSIEHLNLRLSNSGKIEKLEVLSQEYHCFLQQVVDYHVDKNIIPKKYLDNAKFSSPLSERYKQTAGLQALRIVKSYWSKVEELVKRKIKEALHEGKIKEEESVSYYSVNLSLIVEFQKDKIFQILFL